MVCVEIVFSLTSYSVSLAKVNTQLLIYNYCQGHLIYLSRNKAKVITPVGETEKLDIYDGALRALAPYLFLIVHD